MALEVASVIAGAKASDSPTGFTVKGIVMMDSACPLAVTREDAERRANEIPFDGVAEHIRAAGIAATRRAVNRVAEWKVPPFEPSTSLPAGPPPAILLRAIDSRTPTVERPPLLGWDLYPKDSEEGFFQSVIPVPGHHLSLFEDDKVSSPRP